MCRYVLSMLFFFWNSGYLCAQPGQFAFGRIAEYSTGDSVLGILSGEFSGDKHPDVAVYGSSGITFFQNKPSQGFIAQKTIRISAHISKAISADCNKDGLSDIIALTSEPKSLRVYLRKQHTLKTLWAEPMPFDAENISAKDINNDGKLDILLYGKKILGMYFLLGHGDGTFSAPRSLFEDYSFSTLLPYDINDDRVADFIGLDWVNNQLLIFSSVGQLSYSSPSSVFMSEEPIDIASVFFDKDDDLDLAMVFPAERKLKIFAGDGLGGFHEHAATSTDSEPSQLLIEDMNDDGKKDVLVFSKNSRSFSVYFNNDSTPLQEVITYSAGVKPSGIALLRNSISGRPFVVVLDEGLERLRVFFHLRDVVPAEAEQTYALGLGAHRIFVFDVNGDKKQDLLVTNNRSSSVSLFLNRGNGTLFGQIPVHVDSFAESIHALRKNDSTFFLFTTHPDIDHVGVTEVEYSTLKTIHYSIPTGRAPEMVDASYDDDSHFFSLWVITRREHSNQLLFSEIRKVSETNIIEHQIFTLPDTLILAAAICDLNHDGIRDVVFAASDERRNKVSLGVSLGKFPEGFSNAHASYALADTGLRDLHLVCTHLNSDELHDVILQFHSDDDYLLFAYGRNDSAFEPIAQRFSQVRIRSPQDVLSIDIDGNGIKDLVLANSLTKTIQIFLGRKTGGYGRPRQFLPFSEGSSFTVFDFNRDRLPDFAVAYFESDVLRLYFWKD